MRGPVTADGRGGSEAQAPMVVPTSAGGSLPCLPIPQAILETGQDVLPPSRRGEKRHRVTQLQVLAGLIPSSELEGLLVVSWFKTPSNERHGVGKPMTTKADTACPLVYDPSWCPYLHTYSGMGTRHELCLKRQ